MAPPSATAKSLLVTLSMDGQQGEVLPHALEYEYVHPVRLTTLSPTGGGAEGGTRVSVLGAKFSRRADALGYLFCKFNATKARAFYVNDHQISCVSPAHDTGAVGFEVTTNDQQVCSYLNLWVTPSGSRL
jgi:hypothetical protein